MIIPKPLLVLCFAVCLATGCSTYENQSNKAKEAAESVFLDSTRMPNHHTKTIDFFLPEEFTVVEESENNYILEKNENPYILFVNPYEHRNSRILYDTLKQLPKEIDLTSFNYQESFGFIAIRELGDKKCELSVGVGGVKLTTETSEMKLADEAADMMAIVNSITQKIEKT